jgi:hypothetical protein
MNKKIKELRSYTMRYRYLLGVLVVVGALFIAANLQLQSGYIAAENDFIVPDDAYIGINESMPIQWQYTDGNLLDAGFTVYHIERIVNGTHFLLTDNITVPSGNTITYVMNGSDYENYEVVLIRLMLYKEDTTITNDGTDVEISIYWDDVVIQVFSVVPTTAITTTTAGITTTTGGGGGSSGLIGPNEEFIVNMLYILGIGLAVLVVGSTIYRRIKK